MADTALEQRAKRALDAADLELRGADACPFCGGEHTRVVDTKLPVRRRECKDCRRRYNTREIIDAA